MDPALQTLCAQAVQSGTLEDLRNFCNAFFEPILDEFDCHLFWHLPVVPPRPRDGDGDDVDNGPPPPTSEHAQVIRAGCCLLFAEISATASQEHLVTALSQRMFRHVIVPGQRRGDAAFVCTRHAGDVRCAFLEVRRGGDDDDDAAAGGRVEMLAECLLDATGRRVVEETVERCIERFEPRY